MTSNISSLTDVIPQARNLADGVVGVAAARAYEAYGPAPHDDERAAILFVNASGLGVDL